MNCLRLICLPALILTLSALTPVSAAVSASSLETQAFEFLQKHYLKIAPDARLDLKINPVSRTINLKDCSQPIHFGSPRGNGNRISLKALCPSPYWQLYLAAEVHLYAPAVVSRTSLPRNTVLTTRQLLLKEMDITTEDGYFHNVNQVQGWITRRSIAAETLLTADMLKQPLAVHRNDAVLIEASRNSVSIRVPGTALEDGTRGEQVQVRNDQSGIIIKAIVVAPGRVKVP